MQTCTYFTEGLWNQINVATVYGYRSLWQKTSIFAFTKNRYSALPFEPFSITSFMLRTYMTLHYMYTIHAFTLIAHVCYLWQVRFNYNHTKIFLCHCIEWSGYCVFGQSFCLSLWLSVRLSACPFVHPSVVLKFGMLIPWWLSCDLDINCATPSMIPAQGMFCCFCCLFVFPLTMC